MHPRAIAVREVKEQEETNLNAHAREYQPRRNSAVIADVRIRGINAIDDDESDTWLYHYQCHLEECCNYAKQAEAVARNKVCDYCGMTFCKKFNRDRHVQNVHESDIADSILSVCESSALNLENTDRDFLEASFLSEERTV